MDDVRLSYRRITTDQTHEAAFTVPRGAELHIVDVQPVGTGAQFTLVMIERSNNSQKDGNGA